MLLEKILHLLVSGEKLERAIYKINNDGETYDFGFIPHNDLRGTGWKMDIEVLYSTDQMRGIVQERLSEKVAREW